MSPNLDSSSLRTAQAMGASLTADSVSHTRAWSSLSIPAWMAMAGIMILAAILRLFAAVRLTSHLDEASSVLAADAVAWRGLPLLPSGTPYFQGWTLSMLLAPFAWFGHANLGDDLVLMRLVLVASGVVTVYLARVLGEVVTGDVRVGLVTALLVALDSLSVQWSGYVRMYGLLQAVVMGLAIVFVLFLRHPHSWRHALGVALLTWIAVFTHVGGTTMIPAMVLAIVLYGGFAMFRRPQMAVAVGLSALAPVTLFLLNQFLTKTHETRNEDDRSMTFVGDHLFGVFARFRPVSPGFDLVNAIAGSLAAWMIPAAVVGIGAWLCLWTLRSNPEAVAKDTAASLRVMLALYAVPTLAIITFVSTIRPRYLLHAHLLGYVLLSWLLVHHLSGRSHLNLGQATTRFAIALLLIGGSQFISVFETESHNGSEKAMAWVNEHRQPNEQVLVVQPVVAWLVVPPSDRDDLVFLAGAEENPRSRVYVRTTSTGEKTDYWVGLPVVDSAAQLEEYLRQHPGAWIVVDQEWLDINENFDGAMGKTLSEMAELQLRTNDGIIYRADST